MGLFEILSALLPVVAMILTTFQRFVGDKRDATAEKKEREESLGKILETFKKESTDEHKETDILKLMTYNMSEIKEYYFMSKYQAKRAFTLAFTSFIVGLVLFCTAFIMTLIKEMTLVSVLIPAVSGAIVEVLSAGSLAIYNKSIDQLNVYYKFLHENERFLSSVKIVESISLENRDKVYSEIIQKQMRGQVEQQA